MIRHPVLRAAGLLALLAWAPLPFGSVTSEAAAALAIGALLVAALALAGEPRPLPGGSGIAAGALVAVALLGAAQGIPLPSPVARALSSEHSRVALQSHALRGGEGAAGVALSIEPGLSRQTAIAFLLPAAALVAAALLGQSRRARRAMLGVLVASGLFQVLYGAQQWFARATTIWGVKVPDPAYRLRGSFVNPNHLALYLELAVTAAFAWFWWSLRRASRESSAEGRLAAVAPAALAWFSLFVGLAFTSSRMGLLAALAGMLAQLVAIAFSGKRRLAAGASVAILAALVAVGAWSFRTGFGRLLATGSDASLSFSLRGQSMAAALRLWQRFPLAGAGLGTFRDGYPLVETRELRGDLWHAHSDWLELAATGGTLALAIVGIGLALVLRRLWAIWRRDDLRSEDRAPALAALGALAAVGVHELVDFGLTMPANAFSLAVVCGAALAAGSLSPPAAK